MYQLTAENSIHRLSDGAAIPADERNRDYRQYLVWVAEGNEPLPADPSLEPAPTAPTSEQVKAALSGIGFTEDQISAFFAVAAKIKL
jgi:hypothetical protein